MDDLRGSVPSLPCRLLSAVQRRARRWGRMLRESPRPPSAEAALNWLLQTSQNAGPKELCPGLVAALVPTFRSFGAVDDANRLGERLLRMQRPDGSLPDAGCRYSSRFNTAHAARAFALLASPGTDSPAATACRLACRFLTSSLVENGSEVAGPLERWAPATVQLAGLATVLEQTSSQYTVQQAVRRVLRSVDVVRHAGSHPVWLHGVEALLDLASFDSRADGEARRCLDRAASLQRRDGSVPGEVGEKWSSSAGLAHLAALWYRAGRRHEADRALAYLADRQRSDGSWPADHRQGAKSTVNSVSTWTAKYALDASAAQVAAAFDAEPPGLVDPLDDRDGRLAAAWAAVDDLPATAAVVDVGCGGGRYLARLAERRPDLRLTGVDPSLQLLRHVRGGEALVGSALRLPVDDERYDAALCIEALEHALVPQRAVAELCRVVRPGGRVLIVDKDERFRSLSLHEPWERWFTPQSVSEWLAEHCDDVTCRALPAGPHQRTAGLFLAWQGVRRTTATDGAIRRAA